MPLKVVLAAMGAENVSLEAISAALKGRGHAVQLAFDRALFNDAQYFPVPWLARLLDVKDQVVRQIVEARPNLLGISVFADNYQWALDLCRRVKREIDVVVVFGGIHPTTVPETVILEDCVDVVCVGEGDEAIVELAESIDRGRIDRSIRNLWFKNEGEIVRNPPRPNASLDDLPMIDKELFEDHIPYRHYYLTVTNRGCVRRCSFCSENFKERWEKDNQLGPFMRDTSVDKVIAEFRHMRDRYGLRYIDIKNNVLSGSRRWTLEFLERYRNEIGLPFRIMGYPRLLTREVTLALRDAGCHHVQMGIESFNERLRKEVLLRPETNEQVREAIQNMEDAGLGYSTDLILGLPGETEEDLVGAIRLLSGRRHLRRASVFWLEYLPGVTGLGHVMDVQFDADLQRIWPLCDNTCSVTSTLLKVDATGTVVPDVVYARPAGLTNGNIEGFATAPGSTCVDGFREAIWADDGIAAAGHEGHALYRGTFPCDLALGDQGAPATVDLGARGPGDVSVAKKDTLAVRGSGFEPGEAVRIELHVKKKVDVLASVIADEFGLAIADVEIPAGVQPGDQEIWLVAPSATVIAPVIIATPEHP